MAKGKAERLLKRALALIEDRDHWIKGYEAVDTSGNQVSPLSRKACCFCSMGAINRAAGNYRRDDIRANALDCLREVLPRMNNGIVSRNGIISFNDSSKTRHSHVVKVFKRAIELAHDRGL